MFVAMCVAVIKASSSVDSQPTPGLPPRIPKMCDTFPISVTQSPYDSSNYNGLGRIGNACQGGRQGETGLGFGSGYGITY